MATSSQVFKGVDLGSEGHARLCEALEADGVLFCFEVQTCIPDADDHRRRTLDLLVLGPHGVLNVEIDGERHNRIKRREKDYDRDRLLSRHLRTLRFSHDRVLSDPGSVSRTIQEELMLDQRSLLQLLSQK
ncbi:MAG: DUF559 domain-containing protein [Synechococcus sp.]|nr:DUF559 domain-containing protein [Synechococcus sp.]